MRRKWNRASLLNSTLSFILNEMKVAIQNWINRLQECWPNLCSENRMVKLQLQPCVKSERTFQFFSSSTWVKWPNTMAAFVRECVPRACRFIPHSHRCGKSYMQCTSNQINCKNYFDYRYDSPLNQHHCSFFQSIYSKHSIHSNLAPS